MSTKEKEKGNRIGKYVIGKKLGEGGFGFVRSATNSETGEKVAIKVLDKRNLRDMRMVAQVRKEISLLTTLRHPNIVGGIEVLSSSTRLFLVMDYVDGGDMYSLLVKKKRIPIKDTRRYFRSLMEGLSYCHAHGVCHRDLKLENLLLTKENPPRLRICDFGLATIHSLGSGSSNLCRTIVGTEDYSAPEIIMGKPYCGKKADIWSAGVLLFTMITGYCPFQGDDTQGIFENVVKCNYSFPKNFPKDVEQIVKRMVVLDPDARPSADDLLELEWLQVVHKSKPTKTPFESLRPKDTPKVYSEPAPASPLTDASSDSGCSRLNSGCKAKDRERFGGPTISDPSLTDHRLVRLQTSRLNEQLMRKATNTSIDSSQSPTRRGDQKNSTGRTLKPMKTSPLQSAVIPEYSDVYLAMRNEKTGIPVSDRRWRLRTYKKCFVGSDAVTWISLYKNCNREEATDFGQQLIDANILYHVCEDHNFKDDFLFYRFREDDPGNSKVLNRRLIWPKFDYGRDAIVISTELITEMIDICLGHQSRDSSQAIQIEDIQSDERYLSLRNAIAELQTVKIHAISDLEEKTAFLINCHNLLLMHARVELGPVSLAASETAYFVMLQKLQYDIGGMLLSVNDLRNILNGSYASPRRRSSLSSTQSSDSTTRSPRIAPVHFIKQILHSGEGNQYSLSDNLWRPHLYFVLSDGSRGAPTIAPRTAADATPDALRHLAYKYLRRHLTDKRRCDIAPFRDFYRELNKNDTERAIEEMLCWIDEIVTNSRNARVSTIRVMELKQLFKGKVPDGAIMTKTAVDRSFSVSLELLCASNSSRVAE